MRVTDLRLTSVTDGAAIAVPDPDRLVHLQLRRFAGCPVCHLHLRGFARRHGELDRAGVREVVVFHATADELRPHVLDLPFAAVADPERRLYTRFGVEPSPRALLDPRVWPAILRAVAVVAVEIARGRARPPALRPTGDRLGRPADLLIAPDGQVLAQKHGVHADDQWSVDEVLALAVQFGIVATETANWDLPNFMRISATCRQRSGHGRESISRQAGSMD
ncbi:AhpC/TSA family protein [Plantactinospora siamensis]|uniref:AhpC/TSA family protein n=1 Tax=Plantactinospora siamensis TaxID=555372 RepID=A0ABV6P0E1_9ACTN